VLEPLLPDRLGEDFIAAVLPGASADRTGSASIAHLADPMAAELLTRLLGLTSTATVGGKVGFEGAPPSAVVGPVLGVLVETARRFEHVATNHLQPVIGVRPELLLVAGGGVIARAATISTLAPVIPKVGALLDKVIGPGRHLRLDIGAVATAEQLVIQARQSRSAPKLAGALTMFGIRLASVGRRAEGLTAAQEAVQLCRELVVLNREAYLPDLAMSVNNLAIRLGEVGRQAEALTAAQEAVELRRELVTLNREAYLPDLAMSVNNLAIRLGEAGQRAEAEAAAQEATELRHESSQ